MQPIIILFTATDVLNDKFLSLYVRHYVITSS
jgi:hypothetical protein